MNRLGDRATAKRTLSANEISLVSGGDITSGLVGVGIGSVSGYSAGKIGSLAIGAFHGARTGAMVGGVIGAAVGTAAGVGYVLATEDES